jgi:hypothetical protein
VISPAAFFAWVHDFLRKLYHRDTEGTERMSDDNVLLSYVGAAAEGLHKRPSRKKKRPLGFPSGLMFTD